MINEEDKKEVKIIALVILIILISFFSMLTFFFAGLPFLSFLERYFEGKCGY